MSREKTLSRSEEDKDVWPYGKRSWCDGASEADLKFNRSSGAGDKATRRGLEEEIPLRYLNGEKRKKGSSEV
jgi:hypothetical protein